MPPNWSICFLSMCLIEHYLYFELIISFWWDNGKMINIWSPIIAIHFLTLFMQKKPMLFVAKLSQILKTMQTRVLFYCQQGAKLQSDYYLNLQVVSTHVHIMRFSLSMNNSFTSLQREREMTIEPTTNVQTTRLWTMCYFGMESKARAGINVFFLFFFLFHFFSHLLTMSESNRRVRNSRWNK